MVLLGVLDIGKLIELLKDSGSLCAETHQLGAHEHRVEADGILHGLLNERVGGAGSVVPCLHLAWAAFLCLSNSMDQAGAHCRSVVTDEQLAAPSKLRTVFIKGSQSWLRAMMNNLQAQCLGNERLHHE